MLTVIGATVTFTALVTVPYVPEIATALDAVTAEVDTENAVVVAPDAMVTDAGTRARVVLADLRATVSPPEGAGPVSVTAPEPARLPVIVDGETLTELSVTGIRVSVAERDEPLRCPRSVNDVEVLTL
jgi:hypothetical protein